MRTGMRSPSDEAKQPHCFIIMPFEEAKSSNGNYEDLNKDMLDTIFELLETLFNGLGYRVTRADSIGDILADIVAGLHSAEVVCADLTGLNPNVMYELGIRHGFTKKTILLTQDRKELPFDLNKYFCIEYGWKTSKERLQLEKNLRKVLERAENEPHVRYGPVHTYLGIRNVATTLTEKRDILRRLDAVAGELTIIHKTMRADIENILSAYEGAWLSREIGGFEIDLKKIPEDVLDADIQLNPGASFIYHMRHPALELYLATNPVLDAFDIHNDFTALNITVRNFWYDLITLDLYSLRHYMVKLAHLNEIRHDFGTLREAIANDEFGKDLKLYSREWKAAAEEYARQKWAERKQFFEPSNVPDSRSSGQ